MGEDSQTLPPKRFKDFGPRSQENSPVHTDLGKDNTGLRIQLPSDKWFASYRNYSYAGLFDSKSECCRTKLLKWGDTLVYWKTSTSSPSPVVET
jgi:hypothetical protein